MTAEQVVAVRLLWDAAARVAHEAAAGPVADVSALRAAIETMAQVFPPEHELYCDIRFKYP